MALAIEMNGYGGPDVLRAVERPNPVAGPGEVVVRMVAAGVNRADLFIRSGEWPIRGPFPYVPGLEVSGIVQEVGGGVGDFEPGMAVITMMQKLGGIHGIRRGGYQTHVVVPANTLVQIPAPLDALEAARFGLPAVTAWMALNTLHLFADQRVLVHAGSSAVGSMAIQMLKAAWCYVLASSTSPAKFDFIRTSGADEVIQTSSAGWSDALSPVDAVVDLVGQVTFAATVSVMAPGGRLVFVGGTSGGELSFSGWDLMKPLTITGYSSETLTQKQLGDAIYAIAGMRQLGALRVHRVHEFALRDAADAHREMESGKLEGRVLLRAG